jgi:Arc/MetJ-type ribon-helix-helix transcriptional regulator
MKAKMSVTVDKKIVDWIDEQVRTQRFRNRSHAVEVALMKYLQTEKKP